jgi:hypothetical protein
MLHRGDFWRRGELRKRLQQIAAGRNFAIDSIKRMGYKTSRQGIETLPVV